MQHSKKKPVLFTILAIEAACILVFAGLILLFRPEEIGAGKLKTLELPSFSLPNVRPASASGYIPGITPAELKQALNAQDFDCGGAGTTEKGYFLSKCTRTEGSVGYEVYILGRTEQTVDLIDANINQPDAAETPAAAQFLCSVSGLPYGENPREDVCEWIEASLPKLETEGQSEHQTFGKIPYMLYGTAQASSLEIGRLP